MISFDPVYWLFIGPTMLFALFAQMRVKSAYSKYSRVAVARGLSGQEAAEAVLRASGIHNVSVEETQGWLSDHYDPSAKALRLSPEVFHGRSVSAVGIAAHEAGHALQDAERYPLLGLRTHIVPLANIGSWLSWPIIFFGAVMNAMGLVQLGIILFSGVVLFQLVTLPVEFNASSRAKALLTTTGIVVNDTEAAGVSDVLGAAALTYVAATISAIAQLLYFLFRFGMLGRSDD